MSLSQSSITHVTVQADGPDLFITWDSPASEGTTFQVYVDHRLVWFGTSRRCHVPVPAILAGGRVWVDVGTVSGAETHLDFSGSLESLTRGGDTVELSWTGGTYLDPTGHDDVGGFRVYGSPGPGAETDVSKPIADLAAYPGGWICDGFGLGGFGGGGWGRAAASYVWSAGALPGGSWQFRIIPYDRTGTERGAGQSVCVEVAAAPMAPACGASGERLTCEYGGPATRLLRLDWQPSPSAS
jgi:hypothetical protein